MGAEITHSFSGRETEAQFRSLLRRETALLKKKFDTNDFAPHVKKLGLELETWLVDRDFLPAPDNDRFLKLLNSEMVVPELSQFNTEINTPPFSLTPDCLNAMEKNLDLTWQQVQRTAADMGLRMIMIGTLPTLRDEMLTTQYMSQLERYKRFNDRVLAIRSGKPLKLNIEGAEHIETSHNDIMLEAATTSLQIHFQPEPEKAHHYYNASLAASAPMAAICANSPYLFGRNLWAESRIPVFEQSLDLPGWRKLAGGTVKRVTMGGGYVRNSLLELFIENLEAFPPLLPTDDACDPSDFRHVKLHNGSIWRWNRPIIGTDDGLLNVRIEHRVPAAGPTLSDIVGNIALFVGLTHALASTAVTKDFPFEKTVENFYEAARHGLDAHIYWRGRKRPLQEAFATQIIPMAREGLEDLGVAPASIRNYLEDIVGNRARTGQTGATWQRHWIAKNGLDFQGMVEDYFKNQESNLPVYEWGTSR